MYVCSNDIEDLKGHQDHMGHQIGPDYKLRMQGSELPPASLVGLEDEGTSGMLSEMFNFPNQLNYQKEDDNVDVANWYGNSVQAMQLFVMNPLHEPPSSQSSSSRLHMLLANTHAPSSSPALHHQQSFDSTSTQFAWKPPGGGQIHGLSLSLSSNLQHLEAAKVEELTTGDDPATGMLYFNQRGSMQLMSSTDHPIHVGYGSASLGVVKALKSCRYVKAAQELLEEFCSIERDELKINKSKSKRDTTQNPSNSEDGGGCDGGASSGRDKDLPPLSSAERIEHQRRKTKLLAMLDEVERRYNHYWERIQIVVNSFDMVLGLGAAIPYTALAQKAMSRHFRCLKDAIAAQLKHSCGLLGEKDAATSGVTKGETPRLKLLEQSLRQQRAFHQMGMMEPEAWRPQRGLPEQSINTLRAWLFEHFLHPYPSDADKHLLARRSGLSRNQVSNWFINARVRLWKPMIEEMYQQESKEPENHQVKDQDIEDNQEQEDKENPKYHNHKNFNNDQPPPPPPSSTTTTSTHAKGSIINDSENDPSVLAINAQYCFSENQATNMPYSYPPISNTTGSIDTVAPQPFDGDSCPRSSVVGAEYRTTTGDDGADIGSRLIRFGTTSGDVSLTLGLHHAGNLTEKVSFFIS